MAIKVHRERGTENISQDHVMTRSIIVLHETAMTHHARRVEPGLRIDVGDGKSHRGELT
jgi:hypothetical protein